MELVPTDPDPARWRMMVVAGSLIRLLAKIAVKYGTPKYLLFEMLSEAYDTARNNARSPQ
jgi:hypothetical protein